MRVKHFASVTDPLAVGRLLLDIDAYPGTAIVSCALKLSPLVFLRPSELRLAEWTEFDFETKEWRIPGSKMKMNEQHIVPLSRQALAILSDLRLMTGHQKFLFPSIRTKTECMSNCTILAALRRLGYTREEMTAHGFRSIASTLLNELGWNSEVIERQLAHAPRNSVRAAYNRASYLKERHEMMQAWADHLDALRERARQQERR
jgi:integrase